MSEVSTLTAILIVKASSRQVRAPFVGCNALGKFHAMLFFVDQKVSSLIKCIVFRSCRAANKSF